MNFEVNGQAYVLTFLPGEGTFALFEQNGEEVERVKIVHDDGPMVIAHINGTSNEGKPSLN
jgi:hypothetical protein